MPKAVKLKSGPASSSKVKSRSSRRKSTKVKSTKTKTTMTPHATDSAATAVPASTPASLDFESGSIYISKVELDMPSTKVRLFE